MFIIYLARFKIMFFVVLYSLMIFFILLLDEGFDGIERYDFWVLWNRFEFIGFIRCYVILEDKFWNYWFFSNKYKFILF